MMQPQRSHAFGVWMTILLVLLALGLATLALGLLEIPVPLAGLRLA